MCKILRILVLSVLVLVAMAMDLAAPTPQVHGDEPRPSSEAVKKSSEAVKEQLELPEVKNKRYLVVIYLGVDTREDDAKRIRKYYAEYYRDKYGDDVGVVAVPMYAGKWFLLPQKFKDIVVSVGAFLFGWDPTHAARALEPVFKTDEEHILVGIVCYSGGGLACNDGVSAILDLLQNHGRQVARGLRIGFANTYLRDSTDKAIRKAGYRGETVERDFVTFLTTPARELFPHGELLEAAHPAYRLLVTVVKLVMAGLDYLKSPDPHPLDNEKKAERIAKALNLAEVLRRARENDRGSGSTDRDTEDRDQGEPTPVLPSWAPRPVPLWWDRYGPLPPWRHQPALVPPVQVPAPWPVPPAPKPLSFTLAETGGVDFATVELRYLSDYAEPSAHLFGVALRGPYAEPGQGIDVERATELSWTSFFVWLALPDSAFWVNLNPDEPERVIDDRLGKTDVGRILLEADLQMKKDMARLTHPDSPLGEAFWDEISALNAPDPGSHQETSISLNWRVWIVPGEVTVFADNSQIYVVDALLDVKLEAEYLEALSGGDQSGASDEPIDTSEALGYAEGVLKRMILPELVKEVNTAPQYRELRQVFYSRVVAEWYKSNDQVDELAFGELVGQGGIQPPPSQEPWSPEGIFERYMKSLEEGEYSVTRETTEEHEAYILTTTQSFFSGGVDLMDVPMARMSVEELVTHEPDVNDRLQDALIGPGYQSDTEKWIGALFVLDTSQLGDSPIGGSEDTGAPDDADDEVQAGDALDVGETGSSKRGEGWGSKFFIVIGSLLGSVAVLAAGLLWLRGREGV